MDTLTKFIRYYGPYKTVFFLDLVCATLISLADLAYPQILRTLTATLFTRDSGTILKALLPIGAGLFVMYLVQSLCKYYVSYQGHMMGANMERDMRQKLSLFCNVELRAVVEELDVRHSIYELPLMLANEGMDKLVCEKLGLSCVEGDISKYVTLSAGGTSSGSLSSVWVIIPGANDGVCRIYPNGTDFTGAIQFDEGHWETVEENGEATRKKTDLFLLTNGIAIMDRRACVRIANVDVSTETGIKGLEKALYKAFTVIPSEKTGRARIYASPKIIPELKMYYSSKVVSPTYEGAKPHNIAGDFEISGIGYFRPCLHLLNTESTVA